MNCLLVHEVQSDQVRQQHLPKKVYYSSSSSPKPQLLHSEDSSSTSSLMPIVAPSWYYLDVSSVPN